MRRTQRPSCVRMVRALASLLGLLLGVLLLASPAPGIQPCSSNGQIALFRLCNLTQAPQVPATTKNLLLSFNYIGTVTRTSFPFLEQLRLLELGAQWTPMTIGPEAFQNLPNLRILDLGNSKIHVLHPDAFQGLPQLFELRLFSCGLSETVLRDGYFRNLSSLTHLDLSMNQISSLSLHPSFQELSSLKSMDFSLNRILTVCEGELSALQGKTLSFLSLKLTYVFSRGVDWERCGNPFRSLRLETLDVSQNGWTVAITGNFSHAISGSEVSSLVLQYHIMGSGFGFQNIADPDTSTFAGLARSLVRSLDLSEGFIFSLKPRVFETLEVLKALNLACNKINKISEGAFLGLHSLQVLNMSFNLLGELYSFTFRGLPRVAYIDLQKNHLGIIAAQTFQLLGKLETLDLRDNALKTIPPIPSIPTVLLSGNKLVSLPDVRLSVHFLQLSENRLENLADLYRLLQVPHIQTLILNQNRLSSCQPGLRPSANPSLKNLFLGENMLQLAWEAGLCWDVFRGLFHLQVLFLNNNYLSFLPPGVFSDLTSLRGLSLTANRLTTISPGSLPASLEVLDISWNQLLSPDPSSFATLRSLDITHNKFICECELTVFLRWLNHTNVTLEGAPEDMVCAYPAWLSDLSLFSLSTEGCDEEETLKSLRFSLFVVSAVSVTVFLMTILVVTKLRGLCFLCYKTAQSLVLGERPPRRDPDTYKYDAYFCFSSKDFRWVQNALLKHLDAQYSDRNRLSLCFQERDFVPGEDHVANLQAAIWSSRKVVCLLSRHFLSDGWCLEAFSYAQERCVSDLQSVLIVVVLGSLSPYELMRHPAIRGFVQKRQYLRWPEEHQDVGWFRSKLSQHILKKVKGKREDRNIQLQTVASVS
ncbi:toll-like receptor 5 isoform X2 [Octodon degus]|nr:toll-like receptor 5 isoform X2 [Octodon degus]